MKKLIAVKSVLACLLLSTSLTTQANSNIIVEGSSLPDGFYLGMSRNEVNALDIYGSRNCLSSQECSMASPSGEDSYVGIEFDGDTVIQLTTNNRNWETSAGAAYPMAPEEVKALYPDAKLRKKFSFQQWVRSESAGYEYYFYRTCYRGRGCSVSTTHTIFVPKGGSVGGSGPEIQTEQVSNQRGQTSYFTTEVPASSKGLKVKISGGSGDADLYVKKGDRPTLSSFDCRPYRDGNKEECNLNLGAGTYHIGVHGYRDFNNVTLEITK